MFAAVFLCCQQLHVPRGWPLHSLQPLAHKSVWLERRLLNPKHENHAWDLEPKDSSLRVHVPK